MKDLLLILTKEENGKYTKWAEISKNDIKFFNQVKDFFMKSSKPEIFIIYDVDENKAALLKDVTLQ